MSAAAAPREGPVFSEFRITHPFGKNQFGTRVRLYRGLRRIDVSTDLVNQEEFVRYRAVFPTTIPDGTHTEEIPFGAIERPERQEFPVQNWSRLERRHARPDVLNRGLPGNNVADGDLMLSLMRSTHLISYSYGGGFELGRSVRHRSGLGRDIRWSMPCCPIAVTWRSAAAWREGLEFNNPLIARMTVVPHSRRSPE